MKKVLFFAMLVSLLACSNETDLKKSIFIPDKNFSGLPEYSEWGYNSFGAYYDRQIFISNDREVPVKVIHQNNKTLFVFTGELGPGSYYNDYSNILTMTLTIRDFNPTNYSDLISMHELTLDLTGAAYEITLGDEVSTHTAEILNGSFQVKRAQHLLVDEKSEEIILSGVFEFQATINGEPITISNGRFDVGVGNDNFYRL